MGDKADSTPTSSCGKKLKFTPKIPIRKMSKPAEAKMLLSSSYAVLFKLLLLYGFPLMAFVINREVPDDRIEGKLLETMKACGGLGRRDPKVRRKSQEQLQVAIGYEDRSTARSFGNPRGNKDGRKHQEENMQVSFGYKDMATARSFDVHGRSMDGDEHRGDDVLVPQPKMKDVEPQGKDSCSYIRLPLRKPDGRNEEIRDEEEFGESSGRSDKREASAAELLDLIEIDEKARMLSFQLPSRPLKKNFAKAGAEKGVDGRPFQDLPVGYAGKMQVYKSGAVKLKLGDVLFDVCPGVERTFVQDVAAINIKEKHLCILGKLEKHAVVTPDIDSILGSTMGSD